MSKKIMLLCHLLIFITLYATQININKIDGTQIRLNLSEIESITFLNISHENNFEWCNIPAGDFTFGQNADIVNINYDYEIMKYEVTNAQYLAFIQEAFEQGSIIINGVNILGYYPGDERISEGYKIIYRLGYPSGGNFGQINFIDNNFTICVPDGYNPGDFDNHPVVNVTWFGAWMFAEHYGLRLPTEMEWEKAARGLTGYDYPYGNELIDNKTNFQYSGDPWDNGTTPITYYNGINENTGDNSSPYGVRDMSGNVYNWVSCFINNNNSDISKILKSGGWMVCTLENLKTWVKNPYHPAQNYYTIGFRCVR